MTGISGLRQNCHLNSMKVNKGNQQANLSFKRNDDDYLIDDRISNTIDSTNRMDAIRKYITHHASGTGAGLKIGNQDTEKDVPASFVPVIGPYTGTTCYHFVRAKRKEIKDITPKDIRSASVPPEDEAMENKGAKIVLIVEKNNPDGTTTTQNFDYRSGERLGTPKLYDKQGQTLNIERTSEIFLPENTYNSWHGTEGTLQDIYSR